MTRRLLICLSCERLWARTGEGKGPIVTISPCASCPPSFPWDVPGSLGNAVEARFDGHGCAKLLRPELEAEFRFWLHWAVDTGMLHGHNSPTPSPPTSPMSFEVQNRIAELRSKSLQTALTREELQEAIRLLRAERTSAGQRREAKKAAVPDGKAILAKLLGGAQAG